MKIEKSSKVEDQRVSLATLLESAKLGETVLTKSETSDGMKSVEERFVYHVFDRDMGEVSHEAPLNVKPAENPCMIVL